MSIQCCVLASGSSGNCPMIRSDDHVLLIDAGIGLRDITRRLAEAGATPEMIRGICISHEHSDHTCGLAQLAQRYAIPVFTNRGTHEALLRQNGFSELAYKIFSTGQGFGCDDFEVEPFSVSHDAYEPVGFIVGVKGVRMGVVTDMGIATTLTRARLKTCRMVVLEANHDEKLLRDSKRPEFLKQRILGRQGHLSNRAAGELLAEIGGPHLETVFLAHLSEDCNRGELALHAARYHLDRAGHRHVHIHLTFPGQISAIWSCGVTEASGGGRSGTIDHVR